MNILLVEDDIITQKVLSHELFALGHNVMLAKDGQEALAIASNPSIDIIFSDIEMPNLNGFELCRIIREDNPFIPIIAVTAFDDQKHLKKCLQAGFSAHHVKPLDDINRVIQEHLSLIKSYITVRDLQKQLDELKSHISHLEEKVGKDPLTNLYNRTGILQALGIEGYSARLKKDYTAVVIDLDDFKSMNDKFSHDIGDQILMDFSFLLRSKLSEHGIVGRWGGEEFVFINDNNLPAETLESLLDNLIKHLNEITFRNIGQLTVSIGYSSYHHGNADYPIHLSELIHQADIAMFHVKNNGKNGCKSYQEPEFSHGSRI